jgi:hypothetical protein
MTHIFKLNENKQTYTIANLVDSVNVEIVADNIDFIDLFCGGCRICQGDGSLFGWTMIHQPNTEVVWIIEDTLARLTN